MPSRSGKVLLIAVIIMVGLAGGSFSIYRFGGFSGVGTEEQIVTCQVVRGPFDHILLVQGGIESSVNIDVACQVKSISTSVGGSSSGGSGGSGGGGSGGGGGSRGGGGGSSGGGDAGGGSSGGTPILWVIEEGTRVKKGDKLVELDSSTLHDQLITQRIAVSSAHALLISSEAAVRTAEIALQEYLEGTYQAERTAILGEIDLAKQQLLTSELKLDTAERLEAKGLLQATQVQAEAFANSNAQNVVDSAKARLEILDRLTKEKFKVQFESSIEAAKAKRESDASVLMEQENLLKDLQDQISKCVILSPADGIVVHNNEYSSRGEAEFVVAEGAMVCQRKVIIKLPDLEKMQVVASINEQNVALVAEGMAAKIKINALEKELLGRVKKVSKYADPASFFSSSVKKFSMFVEILDPPEGVRTGMTAETRIFAKQIPNALLISVHAIHDQDGRHFCLKKTSIGWETVEIKIGATNDKFVTIESGLAEGDRVALNPEGLKDLLQLPAEIKPAALENANQENANQVPL